MGGGTKKFYASAATSGEETIDGLTRSIEKISTVSGADIRAVLYALVDVISGDLADGRIVRLGDLGSLRISLSSEGAETANKITANSVKAGKTIFTPGPKLKGCCRPLSSKKHSALPILLPNV
ncbi:MAG: HU family DNA-binding protein [Pelobium sp.]